MRGQRGFSLLEVLISIALTLGVVIAVTGATAAALHATALGDRRMALNDDALDAIADVRSLTAYDTKLLPRLDGRSSSMTIHHAGAPDETLAVHVAKVVKAPAPGPRATPPPTSDTYAVTATATQDGVTMTQVQDLFAEAPVPGSTIDQ